MMPGQAIYSEENDDFHHRLNEGWVNVFLNYDGYPRFYGQLRKTRKDCQDPCIWGVLSAPVYRVHVKIKPARSAIKHIYTLEKLIEKMAGSHSTNKPTC